MWVFVPDPQPASLGFQLSAQGTSIHPDAWLRLSGPAWAPHLPSGPAANLLRAPLSPHPGPTGCERSRASGLLSGWKQAGVQAEPSPKDLFIPTCLEVSL